MSSTAAAPSRGALLKDISRLSTEILAGSSRLASATERLTHESAQKAALVERIAQAEAELAAVEAQKAAESANDAELTGLQRAVSAMTMRRQELIKQTKQARSDRDRARDEAVGGYYARLGAECEQRLAAGALAASEGGPADGRGPPLVVPASAAASWSPDALRLLGEADALWKRASNHGVVTRELVDAALQFADLMLLQQQPQAQGGQQPAPGSGGGGVEAASGSSPSSSSSSASAVASAAAASSALGASLTVGAGGAGAASLYVHTGAGPALAEARKGLETAQDILDGAGQLKQRVVAAMMAASDAGDEGVETSVSAVLSIVTLVAQNTTLQRTLLLAAERSLAPVAAAQEADKEERERERGGKAAGGR
jgi:hypothetical protein